MSLNKIFYKVQKHLLKQNEQAQVRFRCKYRTDSGLSCAVGCLIPDQMYRSHANIEDLGGVSGLPSDVLTPIIGMQFAKARRKLDLLGGLQHIHDNYQPSAWPEALAEVKTKFNIN